MELHYTGSPVLNHRAKGGYGSRLTTQSGAVHMPDACRLHTPKCLQPLGHNITTVNQTAYDLGEGEMHLRRGRQVSLRVKRGTLRSKVARGCAVSNKIESLVAEGKLSPSQEYPPKERSD